VAIEQSAIEQAQDIIKENCRDEILQMDTSDGGNADAFAMEYGDRFIYVRELGWLRYNGAYWQHDDGAVMIAMRESIESRHIRLYKCGDSKANELKRNTYKINAAIEQAQAMLERSIDEFDKDPDTINVANGVLHLDTSKLDEHNPEQLFTYALNAPYDANADMSMIESFMATVLTKEGDVTNQELVDYSDIQDHTKGHTNGHN
jgi:putative DNA primase/helicase